MAVTFQDYQSEFMDVALPGMVADGTAPISRQGLINSGERKEQAISAIAIGGTSDATSSVSVTIAGVDAVTGTFSETVTVAGVDSETAAQFAARLATAINASSKIYGLLTAVASGASVTLTVRPNRSITSIATAKTGNLTVSAPTITAAATPRTIPYGFVVGRYATYSDEQVSLPSVASGFTVLGLARRYDVNEAEYPYQRNDSQVRGYPPYQTVLVHMSGPPLWVPVLAADTIVRDTVPTFDPATGQIRAAGTSGMETLTGARFQSAKNGQNLVQVVTTFR